MIGLIGGRNSHKKIEREENKMRGTKEMLGIIGWLKAEAYATSKSTNKPRSKQLVHMQRESRKRNRRVK